MGARRALALLWALGLGVVVVVGARSVAPRGDAVVRPAGALPAERWPEARARLERLVSGLISLQEADGGFALDAPADRPSLPEPEVKRTAAAGLVAWAFAEAAGVGVAPPAAVAARAQVLAYLVARQQPDGSLGRMAPSPLGVLDRGPEVTAIAATLLACSRSPDPVHALLVGRASRALAPFLAQGGVRDGWQRAFCAMAVDALVRDGRAAGLGREPRKILALGTTRSDPDCGDYRLAEAIVRTMRGEALAGDLYPEAVLGACITRETPVWSGQTTDLQSWLMQAWLAARARQGPAWFGAVLGPLEEGLGRDGVVSGGIYADRVTQSACAALVLCLGMRPQD